MSTWFSEQRFRNLTSTAVDCFLLIFLVVFAFGIIRLVFTAMTFGLGLFADNLADMPLMLFNSLRFDMQAGAYAALVPFVLLVLQLVLPVGFGRVACGIIRIYSPFAVSLLAVLGIADIVFYSNFNSHFNLVAFDFFDEEPQVLAKGIANDSPVVPVVLVAVLVFVAVYLLRNHVRAWVDNFALSRKRRIYLMVALLIIMPVSIRGSLGTFTLRFEDTYVSASHALNDCVPSAPFMLKKAWSEKKKQFKLEPEETILSKNNFSNLDEVLKTYYGSSADSLDIPFEQKVYASTPDSVPAKDYNVIVILVESWSNKLIDYEKAYNLDLLCSMRKHLQDDIVFRNFLSSTNGTIDAVENLTVCAGYRHLFTSKYRDIEYPCASAKLFRDNGYETAFISGIEITWRNLLEVLPHQGFERVYGKYEILRRKADAETNTTWGVYDHSMLDFLFDYVNDTTSAKPKFAVALTSTSHTPFEFPDDYELPALDLSGLEPAFAVDLDVAVEYVKAYQYESRALGDFMTALKNSPAAKNTIVMISGDHNIRLVLPYKEGSDMRWKYSVPLYVYMPEEVKGKISADTTMCGSHNDIIPTLANLTLENAQYFNVGQNLFDGSLRETIGINVDYVISSSPDSLAAQRKADAYRVLKQIYFQRLFEQYGSRRSQVVVNQ